MTAIDRPYDDIAAARTYYIIYPAHDVMTEHDMRTTTPRYATLEQARTARDNDPLLSTVAVCYIQVREQLTFTRLD